ncbi:MAG: sn-glycerol-3-phosphate ABC transporter ATP-binding protein UgpC [Methylobacteriaceae bacterium]|nr:sn-glycerol-3-phosphate ABC transporter ATP-binding protein UgpC [Methylobacteriaceae bacterium]
MAEVVLQDVKKIYPGGFEAVKGVSFAVPDGKMCVLVGPSGCGKSTLLRMIAGLETITQGEARIGERRVNELEPMERDIAMVFQNYALYPHMSVFDNMAYGLRNRKTPEDEIETRVREAARILELNDEMLKRKPRQLSGGQRQRVAMGRAIVRKPSVFLFDEPLSNLDAKLRVQMRVEIRKLQRALATTSIYVTHDQLEAMTLADMLVVMNAGRMEQAGAPLEVYEKPASMFVAGFIGSPPMNFLPATIEAGGVVRLESGQALGYDATQFAASAGRKVMAGVRPELVRIGAAPATATGDTTLDLTIDLIEELGMGRLVHARLGSREFTIVQGPDEARPQGAALTAQIAAKTVHLFDMETGRRL